MFVNSSRDLISPRNMSGPTARQDRPRTWNEPDRPTWRLGRSYRFIDHTAWHHPLVFSFPYFHLSRKLLQDYVSPPFNQKRGKHEIQLSKITRTFWVGYDKVHLGWTLSLSNFLSPWSRPITSLVMMANQSIRDVNSGSHRPHWFNSFNVPKWVWASECPKPKCATVSF